MKISLTPKTTEFYTLFARDGAARGLHAVRWGVAGNIMLAWVFTIPLAGLVGGGMELITRLPGGDAIVFVLAILIASGAFGARRWETRRLTPRTA